MLIPRALSMPEVRAGISWIRRPPQSSPGRVARMRWIDGIPEGRNADGQAEAACGLDAAGGMPGLEMVASTQGATSEEPSLVQVVLDRRRQYRMPRETGRGIGAVATSASPSGRRARGRPTRPLRRRSMEAGRSRARSPAAPSPSPPRRRSRRRRSRRPVPRRRRLAAAAYERQGRAPPRAEPAAGPSEPEQEPGQAGGREIGRAHV